VRARTALGCSRRHIYLSNERDSDDGRAFSFCCRTGPFSGREEPCVNYFCPLDRPVGACVTE
jgi:hypothetical protein